MRVSCHVSETSLDGDYGEVEGTTAECSRCGNTTEAYGTSLASERRCLVAMRDTCPEAEHNYYVPSQEN